LSVSLLAAGGFAARHQRARPHERAPQARGPAGETMPVDQSLDAIREAGL